MYTKCLPIISLSFFLLITFTHAIMNGVGLTPPMGWNSWNHYGCNISEQLILSVAKQLKNSGLAQKGYKYVNIDDCWQIGRNTTTSQLIADPQRFPNGIKFLSQKLHKMGLLLGIYSDAGTKTCQGRPGSIGFQQIDAKTFAKWGVDYLKYDNCYSNVGISTKERYYKMAKALNSTGRQIFYSICNWGQQKPWQWAPKIANSWRTTQDIKPTWKSITSILGRQSGLQVYAGKGGWNDPDMLEIGNGKMSINQYQVHFVMWAILKAPLILGCDISSLSQQLLDIIKNQQVIAINQDPLGIQAQRIRKRIISDGTGEIWGGPLENQRYLIVFLNLGQKKMSLQLNIQSIREERYKHYDVRNILSHRNQGRSTDQYITEDIQPKSLTAYILQFDKSENNKNIQKFKADQYASDQ